MPKTRIWVQDHMNSFRTILLGFFLLILAGAFLLHLPIASASHIPVSFLDALFTSASASCVTGLVVQNTATCWSAFGKCVILCLIQAGGLGIITVAIATLVMTGKQIGIMQRTTMQDAISAPSFGGIVRFTLFILKVTLCAELLGAIALMPVFYKDFGLLKAAGYAVFHSVSAFCNAGFDLLGLKEPYCSLTAYASDPLLNVVIMALIISGGLGFLTWQDLLQNHFRFGRLRLQTKIILMTTGLLLCLPFLYFFFLEFPDAPLSLRILKSLFAAVTPRTAGFNTCDYASMSEGGLLITILLMLTGGAPGSTAGGIKVTTVGILFAACAACLARREDVNTFGRRIEADLIRSAFTLAMLYGSLLLIGAIFLSHVEEIPILAALFECASALGTVGLTTGITPSLHTASRIILIAFMFFGRVGGLTFAYAHVSLHKYSSRKFPAERVAVS